MGRVNEVRGSPRVPGKEEYPSTMGKMGGSHKVVVLHGENIDKMGKELEEREAFSNPPGEMRSQELYDSIFREEGGQQATRSKSIYPTRGEVVKGLKSARYLDNLKQKAASGESRETTKKVQVMMDRVMEWLKS